MAVDPDLIMEMAAGRAASRSHPRDQIAAMDPLTGGDEDRREMAVTRLDSLAVIEFDEVAVAIGPSGAIDDAVCRRIDRRADRAGEIDPGMHRGIAAERIAARAEAGGEHRALDRLLRRHGDRRVTGLAHPLPVEEQRTKLRIGVAERSTGRI